MKIVRLLSSFVAFSVNIEIETLQHSFLSAIKKQGTSRKKRKSERINNSITSHTQTCI